jgi:uncharacterized protein YxeA
MEWISIVLAVLQLANRLLAYGQQQGWVKEGQDKFVALTAAEILRKTTYAKEALEQAGVLTPTELDNELRDLESK